MKRPSAPMVIALIALFVALDGPAQAERLINGKLLRKESVTSRAIKDRTLKVKDIKRRSVRKLQETRHNSITEAELANRSVTPGKLTPGAVTSAAIADRSVGAIDLAANSVGAIELATSSVGSAEVADGSLAAPDLGRYYGRFRMAIPAVDPDTCWSGAPAGLAAERAGADISRDLVLVTPDSGWPERELALTVQNDGDPRRFVIAACNVTNARVDPFESGFRYIVIDLP